MPEGNYRKRAATKIVYEVAQRKKATLAEVAIGGVVFEDRRTAEVSGEGLADTQGLLDAFPRC